jgi:hypothetical protein
MRETLHGPQDGPEEVLPRSPLEYYCSGILLPASTPDLPEDKARIVDETEADAAAGSHAATHRDTHDERDEDARDSRQRLPPQSSIGLSFLVTADIQLKILVKGASYRYDRGSSKAGGRQGHPGWHRQAFKGSCLVVPPGRSMTSPPRCPAAGVAAEVTVRWRKHHEGWLVTVALVNRQHPGGNSNYSEELAKVAFFQTHLGCEAIRGRILPYPRLAGTSLTEDEEELELQYQGRKVFAIGHGVAADWTIDEQGAVKELFSCFLPAIEVPLVTTDNPDLPRHTLTLAFLEGCNRDPETVINELKAFVDRYEAWVEDEAKRFRSDAVAAKAAICHMTERQRRAVDRMRRGYELLRSDPDVRLAFSLGQRAMQLQMNHIRMTQGHQANDAKPPTWRPFQLAFLLLALESVVDPDSDERDIVDLLWFPTGGGKTEAYLALIAVIIIYRRLRWPGSGGGTVAIMRYTLRLLTAQQFQRATALVCALEQMRRQGQEKLGDEPITGGLWVGGTSTPNRNAEAVEKLNDITSGQCEAGGLFLEQCPWCGSPLVPPLDKDPDPQSFGIRTEGTGIMFLCPNGRCDFHDRLPLHVVDEHLYDHPPTLLLATVDKFARLAWEDRAAAFFGNAKNRPPEMIIQDELHLIAGPLGSFAGLYEAAIDTVITCRGLRPKYIASTATIRHAREQVKLLYGRKTAIFPPPGHSCDDSFFARIDRGRPGRLYVGLSGQNPFLDWRETLALATAAALAAPTARQWQDELRDAWWTLVIYHGSLRGVGQSHRLAQHDIPENLNRLLREARERTPDAIANDDSPPPARELCSEGQVRELTSNLDAVGIQDVLRCMQKPCDDPESVSLVLCTNMLSVGIDISRLAMMIVNGQPLMTAEYIQASSRVGRDRVPGIVMVNYSRQPRDLSHFENFRPYHESFYRFVEPTSVTPFSAPTRHLALHAALVILMRHGVGLLANEDAFKMNPEDGGVKKAIGLFLDRCRQADPESIGDIEEQISRLLAEWRGHGRKTLLYHVRERALPSLLRNMYEPPEKGLWETMQSMRSVDRMSQVRMVGTHQPGKAGGRHA